MPSSNRSIFWTFSFKFLFCMINQLAWVFTVALLASLQWNFWFSETSIPKKYHQKIAVSRNSEKWDGRLQRCMKVNKVNSEFSLVHFVTPYFIKSRKFYIFTFDHVWMHQNWHHWSFLLSDFPYSLYKNIGYTYLPSRE